MNSLRWAIVAVLAGWLGAVACRYDLGFLTVLVIAFVVGIPVALWLDDLEKRGG